jgi:hypothetical protein
VIDKDGFKSLYNGFGIHALSLGVYGGLASILYLTLYMTQKNENLLRNVYKLMKKEKPQDPQ